MRESLLFEAFAPRRWWRALIVGSVATASIVAALPSPAAAQDPPTATAAPAEAETETAPAGGDDPAVASAPAEPAGPAAAAGPGAGFHSLVPLRVLDSRTPNGGWNAPLVAGADRDLQISAVGGANGVPSGAAAVVANVTVTGGSLGSFLTVWPAGVTKPTSSNVNFGAGQTIPNLVVAKLSVDGKVRLSNAVGSAHVIVDVVGYYRTGTGDGFTGVTPLRVLDSRTTNGGWNSPLGPGAQRSVQITGVGGANGVPSGASAVVVNATVTGGTAGSFVTVWPEGVTRPAAASNLNFGVGQTIPNLVMAKLSPTGKINVFNAVGSVHVILDVVGYYDGNPLASKLHPIVPNRILDSRTNNGGYNTPWTAGLSRSVSVNGVGEIPGSATGVVMNTTVTSGTLGSFLTVYPSGVPRPAAASNLNFGAGETIPNLVVVKTGSAGKVDVYNHLGSVHVIADAVGYFAPDPDPTIPPDPSTLAPPLDPNLPADPIRSTSFLYTGNNPIQTGVAPGTIDPARAVVFSGRVDVRGGTALPGATVSIAGHPEYGQTKTRLDGRWTLVANAPSAPLVIRFSKTGYLPAQRAATAVAGEFASLDDVVLVPLDSKVTAIAENSSTMQVAQGSSVTDEDGTRTSTLLVQPNTSATLRMPDGSTKEVGTLNVRQTEYTVGADGPQAMPGVLPSTSGYTYAVELSADEAIDAGARSVELTKPMFNYTDNFIGFRAGVAVPSGWFDSATNEWVASENGIVIDIVGEAGGMVDLDLTGDGVADTGAALTALGITAQERTKLAELYQAPHSLWRVPIAHFTPWDHNWPYGCAAGCQAPSDLVDGANADPASAPDKQGPCQKAGSVIGCQSQVLGERVAVAGTPFELVYESDRVPGRVDGRLIRIPITSDAPPNGLKGVKAKVRVAGQTHDLEFPATPGQTIDWVWDGKDGFGRTLNDVAPATVELTYVYEATYLEPAPFARSFARTSGDGKPLDVTGDREAGTISVSSASDLVIGGRDARARAAAAWTFSAHHELNPRVSEIEMGTGERRRLPIQGGTIDRLADVTGPIETAGELADGSVAFYNPATGKIHRVDENGGVTDLVGTGAPCGPALDPCGDGGPGLSATLHASGPQDIDGAPDGGFYWVENLSPGMRVRRYHPDGTVTAFAGAGPTCTDPNAVPLGCGEGGLARDARLGPMPQLEVAPDGTVWLAESAGGSFRSVFRRIDPDGRIRRVYGTWEGGFFGVEGMAANLPLSIVDFTMGRDGTIFYTDMDRIRQITSDGIVRNLTNRFFGCAEDPATGECGIGGPAIDADLSQHQKPGFPEVWPEIDVDDAGYIYTTRMRGGTAVPNGSATVYRFKPGGNVELFAFGGQCGATYYQPGDPAQADCGGDRSAAAAAWQGQGTHLVVTGAGDTFVFARVASVQGSRLIRHGSETLPPGQVGVPSPDGTAFDVFDAGTGRHLATRDSYTNATLVSFGYDGAGRLTSMTDVDGNVTTLQRNGAGVLTGVLGPFGHQTNLAVNGDGYLTSVTDPAGRTTTFSYGTGGLLSARVDPGSATHTFTYDSSGRLTKDTDPMGGFTQLSRAQLPDGHEVTATTAQGRTSTFRVTHDAAGTTTRRTTEPSGAVNSIVTTADLRSRTTTLPDGTIVQVRSGPDPRWGNQVQIPIESTTTSPGGRKSTALLERQVELVDPENLLSVSKITDTSTINGRASTDEFVAGTRTSTATTPAGLRTVRTFDPKGRMVKTATDGLTPVTYEYDAKGRPTKAVQGTRTNTYAYDAKGRIVSETDPGGSVTTNTYDNADRRTSMKRGADTWAFAYDARGNRTTVAMPAGSLHGFAYDGDDRRTSYTAPGRPARTSSYSADDDLTQTSWPTGRAFASTYTADGRFAGHTQPDASVSFGWVGATERLGSLASTATPGGGATVTYGYDGDLPTSADWTGAAAGSFDYTFDANSFLTGLTLSSGADSVDVSVARDADGAITSQGPFTFTHAGPARQVSTTAIGTAAIAHAYSPFGELSNRELKVGPQTKYRQTITARDANGRITGATEQTPAGTDTYVYAYDGNGRLQSSKKNADPAVTFNYDADGNLTTGPGGAATFDARDAVTSVGGVAYVHDADGYLTSRGPDTFTYGVGGELRAANVGGQSITYATDGLGRRVARTSPAGTEQYLYGDPGNPFRVTASRGVDGALSFYWYDQVGRLIGIGRGGQTYVVATDHLGTPKVVVDAAGTPVLTRTYDALGRRLTDSAPAFGLPIGYAGGLEDAQTGLVRFGWRDYVPAAGQFAAVDPILFEGGSNLYTYANGDPINAVDPSGLLCFGLGAYAGLGVGAETCLGLDKDGQLVSSLCIESGFGVSGGGGFSFKPPAATSASVAAEGGLTCGPFTAGVSAEYASSIDDCGEWTTWQTNVGAKAAIGLNSVSVSPGAPPVLGFETANDAPLTPKCAFGVKAVARFCVGSS